MVVDSTALAVTSRGADTDPGNPAAAAASLCQVGRANGIDCAVVTQPGKHDWPTAGTAFANALPWLAGQLGTPAAARIPFAGTAQPHVNVM
jgi:S-formylglutathione hydrolase FrmB